MRAMLLVAVCAACVVPSLTASPSLDWMNQLENIGLNLDNLGVPSQQHHSNGRNNSGGFNGVGNTGFNNGNDNDGGFNGNFNGGSDNGNGNRGGFNGNGNGMGNNGEFVPSKPKVVRLIPPTSRQRTTPHPVLRATTTTSMPTTRRSPPSRLTTVSPPKTTAFKRTTARPQPATTTAYVSTRHHSVTVPKLTNKIKFSTEAFGPSTKLTRYKPTTPRGVTTPRDVESTRGYYYTPGKYYSGFEYTPVDWREAARRYGFDSDNDYSYNYPGYEYHPGRYYQPEPNDWVFWLPESWVDYFTSYN